MLTGAGLLDSLCSASGGHLGGGREHRRWDPRTGSNPAGVVPHGVGQPTLLRDGPTAMHRWAVERKDWLALHLALPHGIPSRDCIRRLLIALKPDAFQRCFQNWL